MGGARARARARARSRARARVRVRVRTRVKAVLLSHARLARVGVLGAQRPEESVPYGAG